MAEETEEFDILKSISGLFQQGLAANITRLAAGREARNILTGGEIAAQGALLSARGIRQTAKLARQAAVFNLEVDKINRQRQLSSISRQFQRTTGRQITQQAASGFSITSKSFLQLRNETADIFGRTILNFKIDSENKRRANVFQSGLQQTNLENQARASEFRARAERVKASNKAAEAEFEGTLATLKATQSIVQGIPTILSQILQE